MKSTDVLSLTHKIINGYQQSIFLSRTLTTRNLSNRHACPMIHPAAQCKLLLSSSKLLTQCNAAKTDGVTFTVTSSYRTFTQQQNLYYLHGITRALRPAESKHTQGLAVDISSGSWEWLHQIVGCKNTETNMFNYLPKPLSYRTYTDECGANSFILPVKRSQLYGLSPLCEDLQTDVQWNNASVIRCGGYQKSGLRYEAWHFELDSTFKIAN